ncbi:GNAT family N-acetyltransferase [Paenibacillus tepidiphilus]|uniref:GNAT family N-acetyltransferase n=1 Tax=Paenibacillus tepidiphilus TaxID=2608683 RepID=UPI0012398857|nr:GNAT family N-acetyltransferase [Paenibacillus tepidiphilus]
MNVHLELTDPSKSYIIKNLYPLYLHDLSGHYELEDGPQLNAHGIFEDDEEVRTLAEQYHVQNIWWDKPGCLYPFLIRAGKLPAGFALVATPPHCAAGTDYFLNDFFVLQPFRGKGIAGQAALQVFRRFRGNWELFTNPAEKNVAGRKFWQRTIAAYTGGNYEEEYRETFDGYKLAFRFNNKSFNSGPPLGGQSTLKEQYP